MSNFKFQISNFKKGFTLIELIVVMVIIGIIAGIVLVAVNPAENINSANDARVQNDVTALAKSTENYATSKNTYPVSFAELESSGEIRSIPQSPGGHAAYTFNAYPDSCTNCTEIVITGQVKSKKFPAGSVWRYETSSGKSCEVPSPGTESGQLCP